MEHKDFDQVMNQVHETLDEAHLSYILVVVNSPSADGSYNGIVGIDADSDSLDSLAETLYKSMEKEGAPRRFFELLANKVFSPIAKWMKPKKSNDLNFN